MNILILEDDDVRISRFKFNLVGGDIKIKKSAANFKKEVVKGRWDVLFLDHDLDGRQHVPITYKNTGSDVARFLANDFYSITQLPLSDMVIIIHSLNDVGRTEMKCLLPSAFVCPCAWDRFTMLSLQDSGVLDFMKNQAKLQSQQLIDHGFL